MEGKVGDVEEDGFPAGVDVAEVAGGFEGEGDGSGDDAPEQGGLSVVCFFDGVECLGFPHFPDDPCC